MSFKETMALLTKKLNPENGQEAESVQKSELPADHGKQVDKIALKSEICSSLESGDLSPDTAAVKNLAISKGLATSEAESFATEVLNEYFKEPEGGSGSNESESGKTDDPVEKAALREFLAMAEDVKDVKGALEVVAKSMTQLLGTVDSQRQEIQMLKSALGSTPASPKEPVTSQAPRGDTNVSHREERQSVMKAIQAGKISHEDVCLWEQRGILTAAAQKAINEFK